MSDLDRFRSQRFCVVRGTMSKQQAGCRKEVSHRLVMRREAVNTEFRVRLDGDRFQEVQ